MKRYSIFCNATSGIQISILVALLAILTSSCRQSKTGAIIFVDQFAHYACGPISPAVGPHTEYHFLKEAQPKGPWEVTSFYFSPAGADTTWRIEQMGNAKVMQQSIDNPHVFTHPMISAGSPFWQNYRLTAEISTTTPKRAGIIFRYQNDRQYYFFGFEADKAILLKVDHEKDFHQPNETLLKSANFPIEHGRKYSLTAEIRTSDFNLFIDEKLLFSATDTSYCEGKIALMADSPTHFYNVKVQADQQETDRTRRLEQEKIAIEQAVQMKNPKPKLWKKISTKGFGVGRNLRFGDLNGDGQIDILIGQVVHHASPRDSYSELSALTAITLDGEILWQTGAPSTEHQTLTNDVAFQIFDINRDGHNEVIYTMNCELIIADGRNGKIKLKKPTPNFESIQYQNGSNHQIVKKWDRILGDCLFFCDLRGKGYPSDIVIKNRYTNFWVLDQELNTQWKGNCRTGHYPYAADLDGDGKQELIMGYTAFNSKGQTIWSLDQKLNDHCDGVAAVDFGSPEKRGIEIFIAASDQGAVVTNKDGTIKKIDLIGHVQNPAIANFRDDLPGLETVTVNFWGNQGIIHFFDSSHRIYHNLEPGSFGSMCLPINWNGSTEELFVLNANAQMGGMYNGRGQKAVQFPDDGHPDMCNAVLDLTGDCRDEVVVWDPNEIWVYTQNDNPIDKTSSFRRNPLYNYSNYQLTVSELVAP